MNERERERDRNRERWVKSNGSMYTNTRHFEDINIPTQSKCTSRALQNVSFQFLLELGIWVEPDGLARIGPIFWRVGP